MAATKTAAKKAPAKKTVAKKTAAKRPAPAKKTAAKKTAAPAKKERSMSGAKKTKVGDWVNVRVDARANSGSDVASGLVTAVNGSDEEPMLNVKVFVDGPDVLWLTNVALASKEPKDSEQGEDETSSEFNVRNKVAWPA